MNDLTHCDFMIIEMLLRDKIDSFTQTNTLIEYVEILKKLQFKLYGTQ